MCWLLGLTFFEGRANVNDNLPAHAALGQEGGGFLAGGGEMGALIRSHDWTNSLLGAPETWSPALRMMVGFMLANRFPLLLWWGPQYVSLYNDAYRPILGTKHPWALGQPVSECWKEIWHILQPLIDTPFHGGPATWMEDITLEINRYGFVEETHFTVAYSPVPDDTAPRGIGGVLATVHEITEKVIGERRGVILRDLGARAGEAKTAEEACAIAAKALAKHGQDLPFALLYLIDPESKQARLAGATGVGDAVAPSVAGLDEDQAWPLAEAIRTERMQVVEDIGARFDTVPLGPWSDPPHTAVVLPIPSNKAHQMAGLLVAGISSRLKLDEQYRRFLELMTTQIATAVANARAYEEERKRAEALAEIDRAKTLFFSNVSHEFRTPLTLMLGPVEDALRNHDIPPAERERLDIAHRNGLRLLKLVNTLLDFSRIEAGRTQASYEPTNLAGLTAELASNFRSACERAGLRLLIDCPMLHQPVYVDRDMWEKIVLNLLSNAFKFTFTGEIAVALRAVGGSAVLTVRDTGTGIAADALPRLFERFYRIEGAKGRSYEGTGIGLALVQELVKLHGGTVGVESRLGRGSTFTVSVPLGHAHLSADHIRSEHTQASTAMRARAFVEEALRWLPDGDEPSMEATADIPPEAAHVAGERPRVLLADDNADMREYVRRLLESRFDVETVADGEAALAAIQERLPDLVLSDVMMPRLDGTGLAARLRADPRTSTLPIILLSARADEEAKVEGLTAGADDYLIKPFSARELLAHVATNIKIASIRREATEALRHRTAQFEMLLNQAPLGVYLVDADFRIREVNPVALPVFGDVPGGVVGRDFDEVIRVLLDKARADEIVRILRHTLETGEPYIIPEYAIFRIDRGVTEYYEWQLDRILLPDGRFGVVCYFRDIAEQVQARLAIAESEKRFRTLADSAPALIWVNGPHGCEYVNRGYLDFLGIDAEDVRGHGWEQFIHPEDREDHVNAYRRALEARALFDAEFRFRRHDGEYRWMRSVGEPRLGSNGEFLGYAGLSLDITERKQAEQTQQLLVSELNHRVKNTLASVQAIAQYTLRRTKDPSEFVTAFTGRIQSLSRVHSILSSTTWQGADLRELIRDQLLRGSVDETRLTAWGPAVRLESQMALHMALMLHELGTNANKYGALSRSQGRVAITWTVEDGTLRLRWVERGGPPVRAPTSRGFGMTLIEQSAKGEGGDAHLSLEADGIIWEITLPLPRSAASNVSQAERSAASGHSGTAPRPQVRVVEKAVARLAGKRFLVAEDEPLVALDMVAGLEEAGAEMVAHVGTVADALQIIGSTPFDGAFIDGNLRGQSVDEVAAALTRRMVPFLFVSGYGPESLPRSFRKVAIVSKPFSPEQLIEAALQLVNQRGVVVRLRE
jgi:PAS domain S-box-containing protein